MLLGMDRPNILIFMTDQERGDVLRDGARNRAKTPNLDRFRQEGVEFTQTYCPSPHCCPSRTTFFTGLYPSRHGVWNNVNVGNTLSPEPYPGTPFWSQDLKEAGYDLHFAGKWHVSVYEGPSDFGWDEGFVTESPRRARTAGPQTHEWAIYDDPEAIIPTTPGERGDGEILRPGYTKYWHYGTNDNPFRDGDVVESGIEALRKRRDAEGPWCHYIGTLGPHDPYIPPQEFLDWYELDDIRLPENFADPMTDQPALYRRTRDVFSQLTEDEHREAIRRYLAFCSYEDDLFGKALAALEEIGQADNTLVLFMSDHGDYVGDHGLWCKGLPCFRGAYDVPCVARWPRGITKPGRQVEEFVSLADFAPTFLEIAGKAEAAPEKSPGRSLMPFFQDLATLHWRDALFTQTNGNELYGIQRSIMTRDWKYVYNGFDYDELYHLREDPREMSNVIDAPENREIIRQLLTRLWQFARENDDTAINPYIMVGLAPLGPGILQQNPEAPQMS